MDINDIRSAVTVVGLLIFVGIFRWAYAARNQAAFDDAAELPFVGDGEGHRPSEGGTR